MRRVALIAALVAIVDQLTKLWLAATVPDGQARRVIDGFFNIVHWHNTGAAWGTFQDHSLILAAISALTIVAMYIFRHTLQIDHGGCAVAIGLIVGGIIGNLVDRIRLGHVVDFLDFFVGSHHWPAFNVADSAICVGVGIYLFASMHNERTLEKAQASSS